MTTADKIQMMRGAGLARSGRIVWQNANGSFSHHKDGGREWGDEVSCRTDLRFHMEWAV